MNAGLKLIVRELSLLIDESGVTSRRTGITLSRSCFSEQ